MNAKNCCKTMEMELTAWKAMVYDIVRNMEKLSGGEKDKILSNIQDIHMLIEEMDNRIEEIRDKCTPETGIDDLRPDKEKFKHDISSLRTKVEDAVQVLGAGNFGG